MNIQIMFPLAVLLCTTGCVTTHVVSLDDRETWIPEAQEHLVANTVDVETVGGNEYAGIVSVLTIDSLGIVDETTDAHIGTDLRTVTYVGRSPNYLVPILSGIAGLFVGGAIPGLLSDGGDLETGMNRASTGALVGALLGAWIGGEITRVHKYEIRHGPEKKSAETGKPRGTSGAAEQ
ncbi:MAG: hypothetical protein OEV30_06695 [Ignavibacteria bacterium]|nr:hypothetical protein [Ignavibacteria bacterium]